jgi:hypothetical protein
MRAAARGERRVRDIKAQERHRQGFTADGKLRTEPRTGPWTAGDEVWIGFARGDESELGIKVSRIIDFDCVKMRGF